MAPGGCAVPTGRGFFIALDVPSAVRRLAEDDRSIVRATDAIRLCLPAGPASCRGSSGELPASL